MQAPRIVRGPGPGGLRAIVYVRANLIRKYEQSVPVIARRVSEMALLLAWALGLALLAHLHLHYVVDAPCHSLLEPFVPPSGNVNDTEGDVWHLLEIQIHDYHSKALSSHSDRTESGGNDREEYVSMDDWDNELDSPHAPSPHDFPTTYVFSFDRPLLFLSEEACERLGVITKTIQWDANAPCLGSAVDRWILSEWVGYDTLMMNILSRSFQGGAVRMEYPSFSVFDVNEMEDELEELDPEHTATQFAMFVMVYPLMFWTLYTSVSFYCNNLEVRSIPAFLMISRTRSRVRFDVLKETVKGLLVTQIFLLGTLLGVDLFVDDVFIAVTVILMFVLAHLFESFFILKQWSKQAFKGFFYLYFAGLASYLHLSPLGYSYIALGCFVALTLHFMVHFLNHMVVPFDRNPPRVRAPPQQQVPQQVPQHQ